jgi:putative nucleotidyltransferase-like protein
VTVAEAEGVAAALAYAFAAAPAVTPTDVRARLDRAFAAGTGRHVVYSRELAGVLSALADGAIDVIVLKGAALAETLYPHPALRPFDDLDLLVRRADVPGADARLRGLGYARVADEHGWRFDVAWDRATLYEAPSGVRVDLHWGLLNEPRFRWNEREADTVWERAIEVRLAGVPARVLAREDLLLHLAAHLGVHHGGQGLLWQWDIARLIARGLDWDLLDARARQWRVGRAVRFALDSVAARFAVSVPATALARLGDGTLRARLARRVAAGVAGIGRRDYVLPPLLTDRSRDGALAVAAAVFPSPARVRDRHGDRARSLPAAYVAHAARVLGVLRLALGGTRRPK